MVMKSTAGGPSVRWHAVVIAIARINTSARDTIRFFIISLHGNIIVTIIVASGALLVKRCFIFSIMKKVKPFPFLIGVIDRRDSILLHGQKTYRVYEDF